MLENLDEVFVEIVVTVSSATYVISHHFVQGEPLLENSVDVDVLLEDSEGKEVLELKDGLVLDELDPRVELDASEERIFTIIYSFIILPVLESLVESTFDFEVEYVGVCVVVDEKGGTYEQDDSESSSFSKQ